MTGKTAVRKKRTGQNRMIFHAMLFLPCLFLLIFNYLPIAGIVMAFQDFHPGLGFLGSKWVGMENFHTLCLLPDTWPAIRNTLIIAVGKIIGNLVIPVAFALMLNEVRRKSFKRTVQTITYLPYFLSWVVLSGILINFLSPGSTADACGLFNTILMKTGLIKEPVYFLGTKSTFRGTMIVSDIWKNFGFNTIVYLAALTGVDPGLYEAAAVDGAGRLRQTFHITLPGIAPFIALMTILSIGNVLSAGFDQIFNLYSPAVYETGDIIDTLVYRLGLINQQYSLSAAVGVFKSAVSMILIVSGYKLADKYAGYRVF
ncbi:ABC transporter permease [Lachnotalea sp. AF33-28]|uniref:ABC transporter permease n=1 Tax=Lachnotalea sp. AF33-28 TaxID=2292046 RepID=UPI001FAA3AA2|nr:ABC transporter permease subunit [Lachnotalea sp. AF33-28]